MADVGVDRTLWRRPAEETARAVALARVDDAAGALRRLEDPSDGEALHDFRVAVRRLRSVLRAYRPYLKGSGATRLRRELRGLARATGTARDAEVQLAWLAEQEPNLSARQRPGARWLRRRLEAEREQAGTAVLPQVRQGFERIARRARQRLPEFAVRVRVGDSRTPVSWQTATGDLLRAHASELREALTLVHSPDRHTEAHNARIRAKRLRYLLEPLQDADAVARALVQRLKDLQDLLGEWNDRHVLQQEIASAIQEIAAERARALYEATLADEATPREERAARRQDERAGLLALARLARCRQQALFGELSVHWSAEAHDLFARLEELAARLDLRTAPRIEIERKYLLRALPRGVEQAPVCEIDQGYLPGERWQERLRRVRTTDGPRYFRTVKLGGGVERTELEEETQAELFERLWPLTEGRRVHKRRYRVEDSGRVWEIDDFPELGLVLAEVELERPDPAVAPPDWLQTVLVREVTDDPAYQNLRLAR